MNLTAYVAKLHTHHCPTCSRQAPCELACTVMDEPEGQRLATGGHAACDVCLGRRVDALAEVLHAAVDFERRRVESGRRMAEEHNNSDACAGDRYMPTLELPGWVAMAEVTLRKVRS